MRGFVCKVQPEAQLLRMLLAALALATVAGVAVPAAATAPTGTSAVQESGASTIVPASSPSLYFSEKNWHMDKAAGVAVSVNSGAYLKTVITGSTSVEVELVPTKPGAKGVHYMNVVYSLGNRELVEFPILGNSSAIPISSAGLDADANTSLVLFIYNSNQGANRWHEPANGGAALMVKGIKLDAGGSAHLPPLLPRRMLLFGDSITEGVNAECTNPDPGCKGGDLCANSATKTWGVAVAAALGAEYSQVGFGSLGWVVGGAGGVPAFFEPGKDATNSWDKVYDVANRSFDNLDYIFVGHATNDGLRGASVAAVTASVSGWLAAARARAGTATYIFLAVPFGGFGAANAPKGALKAGFSAYQANSPDKRTFFLDLGREAARGLECGAWEHGCVGAYGSRAGASAQGCDGIHPRGGTHAAARHGELGAMLATQAVLAMAGHSL